jgi:hypothetical protein
MRIWYWEGRIRLPTAAGLYVMAQIQGLTRRGWLTGRIQGLPRRELVQEYNLSHNHTRRSIMAHVNKIT